MYAQLITSLPICSDYSSPQRNALSFCSRYNTNAGTCCTVDQDKSIQAQFEALNLNQNSPCYELQKDLSCAPCDPFAGHLYGIETLPAVSAAPKSSPLLCSYFCREYYASCIKSGPQDTGVKNYCANNITKEKTAYCFPVKKSASKSPKKLEPAYTNLKFKQITGILPYPKKRLMYVWTQLGLVYVFEDKQNVKRSSVSTFLDISKRVNENGELGFLGFALHPKFSQNKKFYVNYINLAGNTVVSEFIAKSLFVAKRGSERQLLLIQQPFATHKGGQLLFGPDKMLYITSGDGGSIGDPLGNGQKLTTLLGKILRINVDTTTDSLGYGIPNDNPFVNTRDVLPEIYAYGLRNPWKCSFDQKGNLWCGDVGDSEYEEIDLILPGQNYGWNIMEGPSCFLSNQTCNQTGLTLPIFSYSHSQGGIGITGGFIYRGKAVPGLQNSYIFGDLTGPIYSLYASGPNRYSSSLVIKADFPISTFGEDCKGELLIGAFDMKANYIFKFKKVQ